MPSLLTLGGVPKPRELGTVIETCLGLSQVRISDLLMNPDLSAGDPGLHEEKGISSGQSYEAKACDDCLSIMICILLFLFHPNYIFQVIKYSSTMSFFFITVIFKVEMYTPIKPLLLCFNSTSYHNNTFSIFYF